MKRVWGLADSYSLDISRNLGNASLLLKPFLYITAKRLFNYEKRIIKRFFATTFVSAIDADLYIRNGLSDKVHVIANGVDVDFFHKNESSTEEPMSIIFTGHMSFRPNVEAVKYFVDNIYGSLKEKLPKLKFFVVGADPSEEIKKLNGINDIIVTGRVDDIRECIDKAGVFVNPMVSGVGIKNKVLQAMSMEKAIVSTVMGIEAIRVENGKDIFIADKPDVFADYVIELIKDTTLRRNMGKMARDNVIKNYSWEKAVGVYRDIYK